MAITRTAIATRSGNGNVLNIASVTADPGDLLIVGIGDEDVAPTSVEWGTLALELVTSSRVTDSGNSIGVSLYKLLVREPLTKTLACTWAEGAGRKALFCSRLTETSTRNIGAGNASASTGAPDTGTAVTSTVADTISIAAHVSDGRLTDAAGTAGDGHTLGQRDGSAGIGITIQETFEILTATGDIRSSLSGATSRNWVSTIAALAPLATYTVDDVYQPLNTLVHGDDVVFVMSNDQNDSLIHVRVPIPSFDGLSDAEVTAQVTNYCVKHAAHTLAGPESNPVGDATRDTRMATFVTDEVIV